MPQAENRNCSSPWKIEGISTMKQNVLLICVDEMRADHMACAENKIVKTPNLDRLAAKGTYFPNACCNNPICMPARATMFTGLLPRDHGLRINGQSLSKEIPVMPQILADHGYRTHCAGKLHLTPWVLDQTRECRPDLYPESLHYWHDGIITEFPTPYYGFQTVDMVGGHTSFTFGPYTNWLKEQGVDPDLLSPKKALETFPAPHTYKMALPKEFHYNRYIADSTIAKIEEDDKEPFFIWCSFPDPHAPCAPPKPYCDMYRPEDIPLPPSREGEYTDLPPFYQDVIDGKLKPNGVDNSNVKPEFFQQITAMTYGMVTHLDTEIGRILDTLEKTGKINNTIIAFITDHGDMMGDHGLLWKSYFTGKSIRPMLENSHCGIRDSVVIENDDPTLGFHVRCLVTDNYRLAVYPGTEHGELFDISNDPDELHNLWYKQEHQGLKNELIFKLLNDYAKDTPFYPIPVGNA